MAQTLVAVANGGCGVAVAFSIFTFAFYIFLRWGVPAAPQTLGGFGEECGATPGLGEGVPLSSSTCQCLLWPSPVCGAPLCPMPPPPFLLPPGAVTSSSGLRTPSASTWGCT